MDNEYSYEDSGLDKFLSRSVDKLATVPSSQIRFDSAQISGAIGDAFRMRNILMEGKAGKQTYFDDDGNPVITQGQLDDQAFGLRVLDTSGVNIAQFGRFPDGSTALKIAKSGYDVTSALNDQLIFNSSQNIFKIVSSGTAITTNATATAAAANFASGSTTVTIAHGLSFIPTVIAFIQDTDYTPNRFRSLPWTTYANVSGTVCNWITYSVDADASNIYLLSSCVATGGTANTGNKTIKFFLLQESAN